MKATEHRLRALIEHGTDVITLHRPTGEIVWAAPSLTHILGYSPVDWTGHRLGEFAREEDQPEIDRLFIDTLAVTGSSQTARFRVRHAGGAWRWMEATGTNLLGDVDVAALVVNQHDITDKQATEEALRQSEQRFRALVENSEDCIQLCTARGTLLYVTNSSTAVFGHSADEMVGRNVFEFVHAEDRERSSELWQKCLDTPRIPLRAEFRVPHPSGTEHFVEIVRVNHLDDPGLRAVVSICRDISDRKELELRVRQSQKMEAIGRLAGGIAHDFNNILSAIHGFGSIIEADLPARDPMRDDVQEILRAVERATMLTRQLLAFGRRQVLQPQALDVGSYLRDMERMLRRVIGEDVELVIRVDDQSVRAKADPSQFEQVVMNLVVNARDAMPRGGRLTLEAANVTVQAGAAGAQPEVTPGPYALITVGDTGLGMSPIVQEHIFEPFFTTKETGQGTGLGLATVFGVVKQSGGHIFVDSAPGKGSTFRVYLPASADQPVLAKAATGTYPAVGGAETILLVEDEASVRTFVARVLRRHGYMVLDASNGGEALLMAEQHPGKIDLLLTDIVMPRLSGQQLSKRLRTVRQDLRVLYMSGYADAAIIQHGVLEPGTGFIEKPLTAEALWRKVREVLDATPEPVPRLVGPE